MVKEAAMKMQVNLADIIPAGIKLEQISSNEYMGLNDDYSVYVAEMEGSYLVNIDSKKTGVLFSINKKTGEITHRRMTLPENRNAS